MPRCDGDSDADGSDDEERKTQPLRGEMSPISDDDQDQLPAGLEVTLPGGQRFPVASLPPDLRKIVLAQLIRDALRRERAVDAVERLGDLAVLAQQQRG